MATIRKQLDILFAKYGGLDGAKRLLRFAQRRQTQPPPRIKGDRLDMPTITEKGKGK